MSTNENPSNSTRRQQIERLADRMLQIRCLTAAARQRGDMQTYYKGNLALFRAQDKFQEGELGVYLRKEADWAR